MEQTNIEKLLELIKENPDAKIIPLVDSEIVCDDSYSHWYGSWGNCYLDEICTKVDFGPYDDHRFFLKSDDDMYEWLADRHGDDPEYQDMSNEEYTEAMKKLAEEYEWKKCIIVRIELPDPGV